jgi:subtilisin family serine protease
MKRLLIVLILLGILSCGDEQAVVNPQNTEPSSNSNLYVEGELLVKFKTSTRRTSINAIHRAVRATVKKRFETLNIEHIKLPKGHTVEEALKLYREDPDVEYAEPNYIVRKAVIPNDTYFNLQWGLNNTGQIIDGVSGTPDADIDAPEAWDIHSGNGGIIVAVIDTGVDYNHPDLSANIWVNTNEIPGNGKDDDGNGFVDDIRGWNFAYNNNNPMDDDVDGHGTHVAGIIGAVGNNNIGVSGVNWNVKIMPLKFLDSNGEGSISDVIAAMNYAVAMGAKVINASYTYPQSCTHTTPSQAERSAIQVAGNAGVLFVAAAGNYGCNNDNYPFYPASHPLNNIISVAAIDQNDAFASWSNYGLNSVHVASPGVNIYSTVHTAIGSYGFLDGTSMATPFVSGLSALIMSYQPSFSSAQVRETILSSVENKPDLTEKILSGGRINALNALSSPGRPVRPTGLLASTFSNTQINLAWDDNSSLEDGFSIEKKTGTQGSYSLYANLSANTTSYSDTSVDITEGSTYSYRIKAYNSHGESAYSNEAHVTILLYAPSNLAATTISNSQIHLKWTDNSSIEEGFIIERKTGSSGTYNQIASARANVTTYSNTGLTAGVTYSYRVRAYNSTGDSDYSNEAVSTTLPTDTGVIENKNWGGCFIATAAYGSYLSPEVQVLRKFRDDHLLTDFRFQIADLRIEIPNILGKAFVAFYYKMSPPIADFIRQHETLRISTRLLLTPIVYGVKYPGASLVVVIFPIACITSIFMLRRAKK